MVIPQSCLINIIHWLAVCNNIHYILYVLIFEGLAMLETMNLNVRISGELKEFVSREVQQGSYENISEYVRDLVRRDKTRAEEKAFERLKAELQLAFSAPDSDYQALSVADIVGDYAEK
jgi:antitoxin ParD1/3/4